jgi:hypothetical protein
VDYLYRQIGILDEEARAALVQADRQGKLSWNNKYSYTWMRDVCEEADRSRSLSADSEDAEDNA